MSGTGITLTISVICVAVCIFLLLQKKKNTSFPNSPHERHTVFPASKQIPDWLENALQDYEKQAIAYYLYHASITGELSPDAIVLQNNLGIETLVRPSLLLFEARQKAGCTDSETDRLLSEYYRRKTGHAIKININATYTVQEMLLQKAQEKVNKLQGN